jgi:hypothetical protein
MTRIVTVDGGDPKVSAQLAPYLPPRWRLLNEDPTKGFVDAIVLVRPEHGRVRRTRIEYPNTPILVLLDAEAPAGDVAVMLDAGADACVRDSRPELVGDQLRDYVGKGPRRWTAA